MFSKYDTVGPNLSLGANVCSADSFCRKDMLCVVLGPCLSWYYSSSADAQTGVETVMLL